MIRYYEGVEGSGKTCMMTRDLYRHKMYGGRVLALPGYQLFGKTKRKVVSELILPEQLFELLQTVDTESIRKQKIAIAMDEVTNFFNNHSWQSKINDILETIFAERRKLGVAVLMTGPEEARLPSNVRFLIHEMVHCTNAHSFNRGIPSGLMCMYYKEDKRGMLSHPRYRFTRKHRFYMTKWHKKYDTYSSVGYQQNLRVVIPKREVVYDSKGNIVDNQNNAPLSDNENPYMATRIDIAAKVEELINNNIKILKSHEYAEMAEDMGLPSNNRNVKAMFASRGVYYDREIQAYRVKERRAQAV